MTYNKEFSHFIAQIANFRKYFSNDDARRTGGDMKQLFRADLQDTQGRTFFERRWVLNLKASWTLSETFVGRVSMN